MVGQNNIEGCILYWKVADVCAYELCTGTVFTTSTGAQGGKREVECYNI